MGASANEKARELAGRLRTTGLPSRTHHMTVLDGTGALHSVYFHVVFDGKRPCAIRSAGLQGLTEEGVRTLLDLLCREVTRRLWDGKIDMAEVCESWAGVGFEPSGFCQQLADAGLQPMCRSVIDAAAKLFEGRYVHATQGQQGQ